MHALIQHRPPRRADVILIPSVTLWARMTTRKTTPDARGHGPVPTFGRMRQLAVLEFGRPGEFDDPRQEWRRLFGELLGTSLLVLVAAGGPVVAARTHTELGRVAMVVAPGLMVMAVILFMGAVSGAHLNPAVTIGFALRHDFPWRRVPGYVVAQLAGAVLACLFLWATLGKLADLGATEPGPGISDLTAMLIEAALTVGLVSVILGTASASQNVGPLSALAVGGYIALAGLWSSPISGASMNPARSFGPDLLTLDFAHYWVYVIGPLIGAIVAVGCAWLLRGPGGDPNALRAARGTVGGDPRVPSSRTPDDDSGAD
jgi:aquaporin Z